MKSTLIALMLPICSLAQTGYVETTLSWISIGRSNITLENKDTDTTKYFFEHVYQKFDTVYYLKIYVRKDSLEYPPVIERLKYSLK